MFMFISFTPRATASSLVFTPKPDALDTSQVTASFPKGGHFGQGVRQTDETLLVSLKMMLPVLNGNSSLRVLEGADKLVHLRVNQVQNRNKPLLFAEHSSLSCDSGRLL